MQICNAIAVFSKRIYDSFNDIDPTDLGSTVSVLTIHLEQLYKSTQLLNDAIRIRSGYFESPTRHRHPTTADPFSEPEEFANQNLNQNV